MGFHTAMLRLTLVLLTLRWCAPQRSCRKVEEQKCYKDHVRCLQDLPVGDSVSECACATELYGICLREAGCAADRMAECVFELRDHGCQDMTVCGSNCVGDGNGLIDSSARVIPVNNYGNNFQRFSVCHLGVNEHKLSKFATVRMDRCSEDTFKVCPYWIPPQTFTALGFDPAATYLRRETCVYTKQQRPVLIANTSNYTYEVYYDWECLVDPPPVEYYGSRGLWPSTIDVEFSGENFCTHNSHCPGSYCDFVQSPPKCSPKVSGQFEVREGAGKDFYDAPFFQDDDE